MFIGVIAEGVKLYENNFFQVYHISTMFITPNFFLSPFSSPASVLAPSFPLLSCLLHKNIIHTQTHVHTCAHNHTLRNVCIIICLSLCPICLCIYKNTLRSTNETKHICPSVSGLCHLVWSLFFCKWHHFFKWMSKNPLCRYTFSLFICWWAPRPSLSLVCGECAAGNLDVQVSLWCDDLDSLVYIPRRGSWEVWWF